ncbi:MAG: hypothetical protein HGA24_10865, partial [Candidatus Aminicenantes bacterium]|nr:hypothetical protein [Candidatus Aminicenantes bacterium]
MRSSKTAFLILAVLLFGCRTAPVPSEVLEADAQEQDLRRAGASVFAGQEHTAYLESLSSARRTLERENLKLGWFRDYGRVRTDFAAVIISGNALRTKVDAVIAREVAALAGSANSIRRRLRTLDELTLSLVERGVGRQRLTRASLILAEADALIEDARFEEAAGRLQAA